MYKLYSYSLLNFEKSEFFVAEFLYLDLQKIKKKYFDISQFFLLAFSVWKIPKNTRNFEKLNRENLNLSWPLSYGIGQGRRMLEMLEVIGTNDSSSTDNSIKINDRVHRPVVH